MKEAMFDVVNITAALFLLMAAGFAMAKYGWMGPKVADFIAKLVTKVALPAMIVSNFFQNFDREKLLGSLSNLYIPILVMAICMGVGFVLAWVLRVEKPRRGMFASMAGFSNTVFLGLPIVIALFGEEYQAIALYYYLGNTLLFWTVGVYAIAAGRDGEKVPWRTRLARLFPPPIITAIVVGVLIYFRVPLPAFAAKASAYLGSLTTPLPMLFIGYTLYTAFQKGLRWERGMGGLLIMRLLAAPALVFGLCLLLRTPADMTMIFMILAAMPVMSQTPMVARMVGADEGYAAAATALTTLVCLGALPLLRAFQVYYF